MFYKITNCANCKANTWKRDSVARRVRRYECFYCGEDIFLNRPVPGILRAMYPNGDLPHDPQYA